MWWDSNTLKLVAFIGALMIAILIWTIVMFVKKEGEAFVGLITVVCLGFCPFVILRGHMADPVISACRELPDGRFEVQDSTRYCYEIVDSTQVFTAVIESGTQLSIFETCTICNKTLFDHETEQHTDAQIYANSILPSAPWE